MRRVMAVLTVAVVAMGLAGCASKPPDLMHAKANTPGFGPDEFAIVPNKPLQTPPNPKALPVPTPGSANLADADPTGDAIAALGGKVSAERSVPRKSALMVAVTRFGTDPAIRSELAAEDLAFRKKHRGMLLERLFRSNTYFKAYGREILDPYAELKLLAQSGVAVPDAPPSAP